MSENLVEIVRAHAQQTWPKRSVDVVRWEQGGMVENLPDLRVVRVAPTEEDAPWTYLSAGAASAPMEDGYGLEFFLLAPGDEPQVVKLVSMVANLHADERYPMSLGQVLEIGHPWLPGSSCDRLMVCLPDVFGPEFEWSSDRERTIRFIWLVPITAAEAVVAQGDSYVALLEKLAAAGADISRPERASVLP